MLRTALIHLLNQAECDFLYATTTSNCSLLHQQSVHVSTPSSLSIHRARINITRSALRIHRLQQQLKVIALGQRGVLIIGTTLIIYLYPLLQLKDTFASHFA